MNPSLQAEKLRARSLYEYVKLAWHLVEPVEEFVDNWHVKALCDHLEAVTRGDFRRMLVNIPPGCMKSLITCVFWPTWVWGPHGWPAARLFFASYGQPLSTRDSVKCRQIIESDWYSSRWGDVFQLLGDANEKTYYVNSAKGWRLATSVGGRGTGEHPDIIVVDDPHSAQQAESDLLRQAALEWWDGTISTRGQSRGVRQVIIMQRLHKKDLSAHVLAKSGWVHICLPMEYEPDRMPDTPLGWNDPRREPGELLWPRLFSKEHLVELKEGLGRRVPGQLQQRPTEQEGQIFKVGKFGVCPVPPAFEDGDRVGLYWDKAATQDDGDYTAGVLLHMKPSGQIFVVDVTRGRWGIDERNQIIELKSRIAASRYRKLRIWVEQEPGSGGKESAEYTIRRLQGLRVEADRKTGSKIDCWEPWASQVNAGNAVLVEGEWNYAFLQEHGDAPVGEHDDQVDAAAGAFNKLCSKRQVDLAKWLEAGAF